ncbi:unnamed protein product [Lasius platythorax]|uniref:Uncharacterized protein n=1 Tax=Lasius platythorax TaxID=488582 RepID=A0AAV2P3X1_9HYME
MNNVNAAHEGDSSFECVWKSSLQDNYYFIYHTCGVMRCDARGETTRHEDDDDEQDGFQVGSKLLDFCHEYNQPAYQSTHEGMESNFLPCQLRQTRAEDLKCLVNRLRRSSEVDVRTFTLGAKS